MKKSATTTRDMRRGPALSVGLLGGAAPLRDDAGDDSDTLSLPPSAASDFSGDEDISQGPGSPTR